MVDIKGLPLSEGYLMSWWTSKVSSFRGVLSWWTPQTFTPFPRCTVSTDTKDFPFPNLPFLKGTVSTDTKDFPYPKSRPPFSEGYCLSEHQRPPLSVGHCLSGHVARTHDTKFDTQGGWSRGANSKLQTCVLFFQVIRLGSFCSKCSLFSRCSYTKYRTTIMLNHLDKI